jgi:biotin carboxyl carrier protein
MARTAATTAVVVGTAGAVAGHQQKKAAQQQAATQEQQMATAQQADYEQVTAPTPGEMTDAKITQLQKMGELKAAGILTEEEFAAEKAKILAS